jgi:hypothetical protein
MTNKYNYGWYDPGLESPGRSSWQEQKINARGETRIIAFLEEMLQEGRGYQVRLGTVTVPVAVDSVITDATAELCYDAGAGLTIIPIGLGIAPRNIATATTFGAALKGVGEVSSAGTVFVPLPLLQGGDGASGSARAAATGGVTVKAELVTDTVKIFEFEETRTQTPVDGDVSLSLVTVAAQNAKLHYVGKGPACIYLQLAATTAFPLTHSHLDVLELLSTSIG